MVSGCSNACAPTRADTVRALSAEYRCLEAENGLVEFKVAREHSMAAVVTDLEMPTRGGLDLMRLLKTDPRTRSLPVVVVTTVTSVDTINECRAFGCAGIVLKPVEPFSLLAKLRRLTAASA